MGIVKEPNGIDFLIESKPLSENERIEISQFIKLSKVKNKKIVSKTISSRVKKVTT